MTERISVLITARNAERTISSSVKSALRALGRQDQVLVLLDQCTDNTEEKLDRIRDGRIRKVVSETRLGINQSRNELLRLAENDFVAVLDADDLCLPWRFSASRKALGTSDMVFGTALVFGSQLRPFPLLPQYPVSLTHEQVELSLCLGNPLVHSTMFGRTKTLLQVGGYSDSLSEDYDLWLRLVAHGATMRRLALPLILYRFHPNQASQADGFDELVASNPTLQVSKQRLVEMVARKNSLPAAETQGLEDALRLKLYQAQPLMQLEHAGLPEPLKRWKNRKK